MNEPTASICYVLGMGGWALDPGGAATIYQKFCALFMKLPKWFDHKTTRLHFAATLPGKVNVPYPFTEEAVGLGGQADIMTYVKSRPKTEVFFLIGDSCGANKLAWIAQALKNLGYKVAYMCMLQASAWCQGSSIPGVPDNVGEYLNIYASCLLTIGLGCYKPQPQSLAGKSGVSRALSYPGQYWVNEGKTLARYMNINDVHPGDTDSATQNIIITDVERVWGAINASAANA